MSRKAALLISAALTVFVLVVGALVAARLAAAGGAGPAQAARQREHAYRERIGQADAALRSAYDEIRMLRAAQVTLLERERIYRQRLDEASRRLASPAHGDGEDHDE